MLHRIRIVEGALGAPPHHCVAEVLSDVRLVLHPPRRRCPNLNPDTAAAPNPTPTPTPNTIPATAPAPTFRAIVLPTAAAATAAAAATITATAALAAVAAVAPLGPVDVADARQGGESGRPTGVAKCALLRLILIV